MEKQKATQVTGCSQCKKSLSGTQKYIMLGGIYLLGTSIYGTIQLVKLIISLF